MKTSKITWEEWEEIISETEEEEEEGKYGEKTMTAMMK